LTIWDSYPASYRHAEVEYILTAVSAGECVAVAGLSGSGKSNLLAFLAHRVSQEGLRWALVDCNQMEDPSAAAFYRLILNALGGQTATGRGSLAEITAALAMHLTQEEAKVCILFDRFDAIPAALTPTIAGNLRALRDVHKYHLAYVIAARRPPDPQSELGELFFAHTLWLGPLAFDDASWSIRQFARRHGLDWEESTIAQLIQLSGGYPAWLRAACEAHASGAALEAASLRRHPAVQRRLAEFWADEPTQAMIADSSLQNNPFLGAAPQHETDTSSLTAKELLLLQYLQAHPAVVCEKDDLIRAVWPEDRAFIRGIRDDSLAQLVRRLREKIEADPSAPRLIQTVPGRGYRYMPRRLTQ
jgi:energy-coupling factor transporter ATP-binding protein EcfA2